MISLRLNLEALRNDHSKAAAAHTHLMDGACERAGDFARQYVQTNARFKRRTGKLQDGTQAEVIKRPFGRILRIFNLVSYAGIIEAGSRAHRITARHATFLRFVGKNGQLVFRKSVWHPGTRPYQFLYRATHAAFRVLEDEIAHAMNRVAQKF